MLDHAELAAQLALKGLLRGVGAAREAWGHALSDLAAEGEQSEDVDGESQGKHA